jgi:hypothetical protein
MDRHERVGYDAAMRPQQIEAQTSPSYGTPEPQASLRYGMLAPAGPVAMHPDPLPPLCAEFPGFRIWREITGDRTGYIARSLHPCTSPHTVVTDDLSELRDVLHEARATQPPDASTPQ